MFKDIMFSNPGSDEVEYMPLFSVDEDGDKEEIEIPKSIPILALRNTVLYPGIIIPITVGREKSVVAINKAFAADKMVGVLSQKDYKVEDPGIEDLFQIGTVAKIVKLLKMPDGTTTAILHGKTRFELSKLIHDEPFLLGEVLRRNETGPDDEMNFKAMISSIKDRADEIIKLSPHIPAEAQMVLKNIEGPNFLLNFIASNLSGLKITEKQDILLIDPIMEKAEIIIQYMDKELQLLKLKDQIENKVRGDLEKQQRDYFLGQQLKTIQDELGQNPNAKELDELVARAGKKKWPKEAKEAFDKDMKRLRRTNPAVAEYSILVSYLELLLDLPWDEVTKDSFSMKRAESILEKDHFGLEKVKERILEYLAVLKLKKDMKSPIICLVGPPGVGKTSLGKSIARALKRKYVRMSLGGLHDESEVRGHRKTYIGAMPGRVIQSIRKAGTSNPVFILDEIDKIGKDHRGDPSSALLEVLDPEQNGSFHDNYLDLDYDLSKVLFIATANSLNTIQPALLDRMEIIEVSGYSLEEKVEIAKKHLLPKQREAHGLETKDAKLKQETLAAIVQKYTRESGVRDLDRKLASVMRSIAKAVAMKEEYNPVIEKEKLYDYLGPEMFSKDLYDEIKTPGVATGLAWTRFGGDILFIETSISPGKGTLTLTGNLGDVMKESATTALSFLKAHAAIFGLDSEVFEKNNIHIHVPEGAIPKDGPSAGITMLSALTSAFIRKPIKPYMAMTGEITLRGKVLPVGGIKEKILAAKRAGIKEIMMCKQNEKDVLEVKADYLKGLTFHYVSHMNEVVENALGIKAKPTEVNTGSILN